MYEMLKSKPMRRRKPKRVAVSRGRSCHNAWSGGCGFKRREQRILGNQTLFRFPMPTPKTTGEIITKMSKPTQGTNRQEHYTHNLTNRKQAHTKTGRPNRLE
jgi:hypothetical protein